MRLCAGFLLLLLSCASAAAEPLTGAAREALAGEWRANPDKPDGACGPDGGPGDIRMVIEFALTGGSISLDDGSEGGGEYAIASGSADKAHVALALKDGGTLSFTRANGLLKAASSDDVSVGIGGMNFKRCREPAGRSAIKLSKAQIAEISSALPPKNYVFVDMRAKAGCKALDYQYVFFDLVGPLGFSAGRWNSYDLAERLAGGKKPSLAIDEIANFPSTRRKPRRTAPASPSPS